MKRPVLILMTTAPRHGSDPWGLSRRTFKAITDEYDHMSTEDVRMMVSVDGDRKGNIAALRMALAKTATFPDHDVLWLEDDLIFCKNAVRYMVEYEQTCDAAFTAFFECIHFPEKVSLGLPHVYHVPLSAGLTGLQAVRFPAETIAVLRGEAETCPLPPEILALNSADTSVSYWLRDFDTYCVHMPNVVQHVGKSSIRLGEDGQPMDRNIPYFQSSNFAGVDFDAMTLR